MNTNMIALQPKLAEQVRWIAKSERGTIEDFVNKAIRERLRRLEDQKLEAEARVFERMHSQLVEQYLGQFVAVHDSQVVDADVDFEALFLRLQNRFGDIPILIRLVGANPILELRAPSPRLEMEQMMSHYPLQM